VTKTNQFLKEQAGETSVVWSSCNVNCGSRCPLRLHVQNGEVVRIDPENTGDDPSGTHEVRACLRGRGLRQWVYSRERLLKPLKRVGKRGEGRFAEISWDEALDHVAGELDRIINTYGNEAVYRMYGTGNLGGVVSSHLQVDRLMNILGGQLNFHNNYSNAQLTHAMQYTYGQSGTGNPISDLVNSRLAVFFGNNPAETRMSGGGTIRDLVVAKQQNDLRVIVIDPRYTDTAAGFADEWIPIRPGTDAALVSGLAYVLISESLVDLEFLARYSVGYDSSTMPSGVPTGSSYKDYIRGESADGIAKTPQWAAAVTGIPDWRIIQLAREIGTAKPVYIAQGWGPQRHANGEQTARAIAMLPILTGNVGIPGGNSGDREGKYEIDFPKIPVGENPVKTSIPCFLWTRAVANPTGFTRLNSGLLGRDRLATGIKFIWNVASNTLINQHSDINRTKQILADERQCETIVVIDTVMTPSARFADIVLPSTTAFEESDLCYQSYAMEVGFLLLRRQAIAPRGESRTLYDTCAELADRLGAGAAFTENRSHDDWVEHLYHQCRRVKPELPADYRAACETGLFKWAVPADYREPMRNFREDPQRFPLATPSGKIEIFSSRLAEMAQTWELQEGESISALPEYQPPAAGTEAQEQHSLPLMCVGHHYKQRTHSSYANNPWLTEAAPQTVWIHPWDAQERGVEHGDLVRIFNQHGSTAVQARVTPRIMPGVLSLPQGAWYLEGEGGVDRNGCINILTSQHPSPVAKGNPQHTNWVQLEKISGKA